MTNLIRDLVSGNNRRLQSDGIDLDLTYITPRIIAMGYPAENLESLYRNKLDDVAKYLNQTHGDHYKVYNLCSEKAYDASKFSNRVTRFPVDDHNPPAFDQILAFCSDAHHWFILHPNNVIAVHCNAGRNRTGVMVSSLLLYLRQFRNADDAVHYFGITRTVDGCDVKRMRPSQSRYVHYFAQFQRYGITYTRVPYQLWAVEFKNVPYMASSSFSFTVKHRDMLKQRSAVLNNAQGPDGSMLMCFVHPMTMCGDSLIKCVNDSKVELFQCWLNTLFINDHDKIDVSGRDGYDPIGQYNISPASGEQDAQQQPAGITAVSCYNMRSVVVYSPPMTSQVPMTSRSTSSPGCQFIILTRYQLDTPYKDRYKTAFPPDFQICLYLTRADWMDATFM